jgi:hypothetical protein
MTHTAHLHRRPKSPRANDTLTEILIDESARASSAISLHRAGSRTTEGCWWCEDGHAARPGPEPEKCRECERDERVAQERMGEK